MTPQVAFAGSSDSPATETSDCDDNGETYLPLEHSQMGSEQRDIILAVHLIFFSVLYSTNPHASRAIRLLFVMLSLMAYLPRVISICHSRDTTVLVSMGGFLYWLVITPTNNQLLSLLLTTQALIILWLQCQSLLTTLPRSYFLRTSRDFHQRTLLKALYASCAVSSIAATIICIIIRPHYNTFHCAIDAFVLQAVASVFNAKVTEVNETSDIIDVSSSATELKLPLPPEESVMNTRTDVIFSSFFAYCQKNQCFLVKAVALSLVIFLVPLSMLLILICFVAPDLSWLAQITALVVFSSLWPLWFLTTTTTSTFVVDLVDIVFAMPVQIHVMSDASLVVETLSNKVLHERAVRAYHHHYFSCCQPSEKCFNESNYCGTNSACCLWTMDWQRQFCPGSCRHKPCSVVEVEFRGQRYLRLAPANPSGLIRAIRCAVRSSSVLSEIIERGDSGGMDAIYNDL